MQDWTDEELAYRLRRQEAPGVSTWGTGKCGHYARGSGYCADCIRKEIARRAEALAVRS